MFILVFSIVMIVLGRSSVVLGLRSLTVPRYKPVHSLIRSLASSILGSDQHSLTIEQAHKAASEWLDLQGVPEPSESSRHLLMHAASLGTRNSDFQASRLAVLTSTQRKAFESLIQQRSRRVPVQYLVGNWDFYGLLIACQAPILIPRPETEELVEKALEELKAIKRSKIEVLDVGAGTGAIGIALCAQMSTVVATAIDINPLAVELARKNAQNNLRNDQQYSVLECDFESFAQKLLQNGHRGFDLIVSNPPYIPSRQLAGLQAEVVQFEDKVALDGGLDGLDIIKQLVEWGGRLLSPEGTRTLWLEVDTSHPTLLIQLFSDDRQNKEKYSIESVDSYTDLSGNPRLVRVKYA